jgi:two-component system OmpR family sensor kinase
MPVNQAADANAQVSNQRSAGSDVGVEAGAALDGLRQPQRQRGAALAPWSLQRRLRRDMLGLLAAVWLVASIAACVALRHETDEVLDSALAETAQRLLLLPESALSHPDAAAHLAQTGAHEEFVVYQVYDGQRQLRLRSHEAPTAPLDSDGRDGLRRSNGWLVLTLNASDGQHSAQVAERISHRWEVLWASGAWLLALLTALLPLAALTLTWLLRRAFASLEPTRRELAGRPSHDLRPLCSGDAPAELQTWLSTVNDLLARVAGLVESERSFAANAAHELRTPLAAASAQAQRLALSCTDMANRNQAQALRRRLDRLAQLTARLLQMARIEAGVALLRQPVDLEQLAVLVLDEFADTQRSVRLKLQVLGGGGSMQVHADVDALGIALRNLIDNALSHGGDTGVVTVRVGDLMLQVEDDGPGVPADRLPHLVRKFDRGGNRHSLLGSGLGLSMVDTIVRQTGAGLELLSPVAEGRGFCATIRFDVHRAPTSPSGEDAHRAVPHAG